MQEFLGSISSFVWGPITIVLLVGTGILVTLIVPFIQLRKFGYAWKLISGKYDDPEDKGGNHSFPGLERRSFRDHRHRKHCRRGYRGSARRAGSRILDVDNGCFRHGPQIRRVPAIP